MALRELNRIAQECITRFSLIGVRAVHRTGNLRVGDVAIWLEAWQGIVMKRLPVAVISSRK